MVSMIEAHFCGTNSQSSIYGLTSLFTSESSHKILVASSKRKIYCIEYSKKQQSVIFSTREVQFTYIPGGAEIISIDAFNQVCHKHDFVIGIAFTKADANEKRSQYFNIYSDWEPSNECDLDNIAQGCLSISLDFMPFHLTHTQLYTDGQKEMVWLLSGNDDKIHLYREDKELQTYKEEPSSLCFPEFDNLHSIVMWMDFVTSPDFRVTALGCQDAKVIVTRLTLVPETKIVSFWHIVHDGPISTIKLFRDSDLNLFSESNSEDLNKNESENLHVLVGNTLEVSVVYRNVLENGLTMSSQFLLRNSHKFDCVTCCIIADIDMDGDNELILGTYGQQLLVYKWNAGTINNRPKYSLIHQHMLSYPILAMRYIDIIGDGVKELVILTTKGVHIFQHDLKKASNLCLARVKHLMLNSSNEEISGFLLDKISEKASIDPELVKS